MIRGVTLVLRLVAGVMFAAAIGVVVTALAASAFGGGAREWMRSIAASAFAVAGFLGAGAAGAFLLMPSQVELWGRIPPERGTRPLAALDLALAALAVAVAWLVPGVLGWWAELLALLPDVTLRGTDPLGLNLVPIALLFSAPLLASSCLVVCVLTSALVFLAPATVASRTLAACILLQGGLVGGAHAMGRATREIGRAVQRFVDGAADPAASAQVTLWLERYEIAGGSLETQLIWLVAGYALALAVCGFTATRGRAAVDDEAVAAACEIPSVVATQATAVAPSEGTSFVSDGFVRGEREFQERAYLLRPRFGPLELLEWKRPDYEITSIPPTSRARYSLSSRRGVIRREPAGPDLVSFRAVAGERLFERASYAVTDPRSALPIGTLVPVAYDWEVHDASGSAVADVRTKAERYGYARYVAVEGEREICRFLWCLTGLTVASAELRVEFSEDGDDRFDRALMIVLAALLEHRARRSSGRDYRASVRE